MGEQLGEQLGELGELGEQQRDERAGTPDRHHRR